MVLSVRLHGVRGSAPAPSTAHQRYGGDTSCYEIELGNPGQRVFIDCGTGLRNVAVSSIPESGASFDILFSHFHWDHIAGLPVFSPIYLPQHRFTFRGRPDGASVREALEDALRPPWFPVALAETPSEKSYEEVLGAGFDLGPARVTPLALNHPQGAIGYRFDVDGSSLAIATDHESANGDVDRAVIEWARGTDVLLHDAQYTRVDYEAHEGWGHSTWESAVDTAIAAEVGQLVTVSHDPSRTDDELDDLTRRARERFPRTRAGAAGTRISVGA